MKDSCSFEFNQPSQCSSEEDGEERGLLAGTAILIGPQGNFHSALWLLMVPSTSDFHCMHNHRLSLVICPLRPTTELEPNDIFSQWL